MEDGRRVGLTGSSGGQDLQTSSLFLLPCLGQLPGAVPVNLGPISKRFIYEH